MYSVLGQSCVLVPYITLVRWYLLSEFFSLFFLYGFPELGRPLHCSLSCTAYRSNVPGSSGRPMDRKIGGEELCLAGTETETEEETCGSPLRIACWRLGFCGRREGRDIPRFRRCLVLCGPYGPYSPCLRSIPTRLTSMYSYRML